MITINIKATQNPAILKFEFPDFITQNESFEFKNIDEAKSAPLAQQLFYLPFVKTVYISGNFIAIEKYSIVEWNDVQDAVAEQIETFVNNGGVIITVDENKSKKQPIIQAPPGARSLYSLSTLTAPSHLSLSPFLSGSI